VFADIDESAVSSPPARSSAVGATREQRLDEPEVFGGADGSECRVTWSSVRSGLDAHELRSEAPQMLTNCPVDERAPRGSEPLTLGSVAGTAMELGGLEPPTSWVRSSDASAALETESSEVAGVLLARDLGASAQTSGDIRGFPVDSGTLGDECLKRICEARRPR
jgi:hypothetical protein